VIGAESNGLCETGPVGLVAANRRDETFRLIGACVGVELLEQRPRDAASSPLGRDAQTNSPRAIRRCEHPAVPGRPDRLDPAALVFDEEGQAIGLRADRVHPPRRLRRRPAARRCPSVLELDDPLDVCIFADAHAQIWRQTLRDSSEIGGHEGADYNR
jgi:hypothetical protein